MLTRTFTVRCSVEHAFETFTERVHLWWPKGHRRFEGSELILEARPGGRFYERAPDGREALLGEVLTAEPPHRLIYAWHPGAPADRPTEVELLFTASSPDLTTVTIHHRPAKLAGLWPTKVALFERGWTAVTEAFTAFVEITR